jgi:hypothetical protein
LQPVVDQHAGDQGHACRQSKQNKRLGSFHF